MAGRLAKFRNYVRRMDRAIRRRGFMGYWAPNTPDPDFVPRTDRSLSPVDRKRIADRDGWLCSYCLTRVSLKSFEIDHVIPIALGGTDAESNLVLACSVCNRRKGKKPVDVFLVEIIVGAVFGGGHERWQENA